MWCGWSSFRSNRRRGTLGRSEVSRSSGGGKAVEVSVEVALKVAAVPVEDDEDAEEEAD